MTLQIDDARALVALLGGVVASLATLAWGLGAALRAIALEQHQRELDVDEPRPLVFRSRRDDAPRVSMH